MYKTLLCVNCGALFGCLARLGVVALTTYPGAFAGGVVWANFGACLVMGFLVHSTRIWARVAGAGAKSSVALYAGCATGFCGTFSSFSTVVLDVFEQTANTASHAYPTGGYGVMEFFSGWLVHLGTAILGFKLGQLICTAVEGDGDWELAPVWCSALEWAAVVVGLASYVVMVVLAAVQNTPAWHVWMFSCIFAPVGACLRFYLLRFNKSKGFPVGTFAANAGGTVVLAALTIALRGRRGGASSPLITRPISCAVVTGVDNGFCGGLTTMSTLVAELYAMRAAAGFWYALGTIAALFCLVIVTLGSYHWAVGLTGAVC
jgi:CrcB protein